MAENRKELFRESALERLSSPDQLDRLVAITRPRDWLATLTIGLLLMGLIAWGFLGRVSTTVQARGLIVPMEGAVTAAVAYGPGRLANLKVAVGDWVEEGQLLAQIIQPVQLQRLENARAAQAEMQAILARETDQAEEQRRSWHESIASRRTEFEVIQQVSRARIEHLQPLIAQLESHLGGAVTLTQIEDMRDEIGARFQALEVSRANLSQAEAVALEQLEDIERQLNASRKELEDRTRQLSALEAEIRTERDVLAPAAGRVVEIAVVPGARVDFGQVIVGLAGSSESLETVVYVPFQMGKKLRTAMPVRISPHAIRKEEFGSIRGRVIAVSDFPVSPGALQARVGGQTLAQALSGGLAVYEARILLETAATPSGFAWTSGSGPHLALTAGSTVEAEIIVQERRPVDLIIPFVRAQFEVGR